MNIRKIEALALPLSVALWCLFWVQPVYSQNAPQQPSGTASASSADSASTTKGATKEKHWSGDLVDVGCMASALQPSSTAAPSSNPAAGMPHFAGPADPAPQTGQSGATGQSSSGASSSTPSRDANGPPTGNTGNMGATDSQDQARMEQADRMNSAIKKCTPTASTQTFGLAMGNGQVVQFNSEGNLKATEAMRENPALPGKKVKAKVAGSMLNSTTVNVASLELKSKNNKHAQPSS